jgi:hypothetical protein
MSLNFTALLCHKRPRPHAVILIFSLLPNHPRYDEIVEPRTFYMDQHPYSSHGRHQQGHLGSANHHGADNVNVASVVEAELAMMESNGEAMRCFGKLGNIRYGPV